MGQLVVLAGRCAGWSSAWSGRIPESAVLDFLSAGGTAACQHMRPARRAAICRKTLLAHRPPERPCRGVKGTAAGDLCRVSAFSPHMGSCTGESQQKRPCHPSNHSQMSSGLRTSTSFIPYTVTRKSEALRAVPLASTRALNVRRTPPAAPRFCCEPLPCYNDSSRCCAHSARRRGGEA
jgi:hypothetical protein